MKQFLQKHLGASWKTTLVSYALAALLAVQPLLDAEVDLSDRSDRTRYVIRIVFAAGVALLGKYAADSSQVKSLKNQNHGPVKPDAEA